MTTATARRLAALSAALALPLALVSATPATAATVGVTTWDQLQTAFSVDGNTVRLDGPTPFPVTAGESLVVGTGASIILDLNGNSLTITDPADLDAAISVPSTSSLTINDTSGGGTLTATGGSNAAGIGGDFDRDGGTTTINGGTIYATGGEFAAGIGGGFGGDGGTTTITGGTTTATGSDGAGIGGGFGGDGGTTTISGGTTTATGSDDGAGIGGGFGGDGGTTTITGGTTTATGGDYGAGIGGGYSGDNGTTTITGGIVEASGGLRAAGIGGGGQTGGTGGNGGIVSLSGGTIAATGGADAAGIGAGFGTFSAGAVGILAVSGTGGIGAAIDGGQPLASPITNPTMPAGVGYAATTSTVDSGGRIELRFNYLVTFDANGGSTTASQTINDGDTLTEPAPPTRAGFTFAGWTLGMSAYDFTTPITEPLELTATWTAVLAETGTDVTAALSVATLLLAGGVTLIALRRRNATHSS